MQKFKIGQVVNVCINQGEYKINCKGTVSKYLGDLPYPYRVVFDENGINQYNSYNDFQYPSNYEFLIAESELSELSEVPKRNHKARQLQVGDTVQIIDKEFKDYLKKAVVVDFMNRGGENFILIKNIHDGYQTLVYRHEIRYILQEEIKNRHYETLMNFDDNWGGFFNFLESNNIINIWKNGYVPTHVSEEKQMIYSLMLCLNDEDLDIFLNELKNYNS